MSFDPLMKAIKDNPALLDELTAAKTPRERHAILDAHGIEKPNLDSQYPSWNAVGGVDAHHSKNGECPMPITPFAWTPGS